MSRGRGRRSKYPTSWEGRRNGDPRRQADSVRAIKRDTPIMGEGTEAPEPSGPRLAEAPAAVPSPTRALAQALQASDLIRRYQEYAHEASPDMAYEPDPALAYSWSPAILAALPPDAALVTVEGLAVALVAANIAHPEYAPEAAAALIEAVRRG